MKIIIEDVLTVTMNDSKDIGIYTIVIDEGKISLLTKEPYKIKKRNDDIVIGGKDRIALPGFINGHIHSDIILARGLGDGLTLYEQDNNSFVSRKQWFNRELDREARYYSKLLQYVEAVKGGTAFICDVPFWHHNDDLLKPFKKIGVMGAVVLDFRKNFLTGEMIDKKEYLSSARYIKEHGYMPIVEGPAEEHYERELLNLIKTWAEELDTLIQMHLAETTWRVDITQKKYGKTPVRYLHDVGFLNSRLIGSHGVYIDSEELGILKRTGARIINCPVAEMKISDGIAPVSEFISNNIPLGIGTDGALWNDSADMFAEMKSLMLLQRVSKGAASCDAYSCLHAATRGGARVFGLEKELGSIEPGKRACITLIDYMKPHIVPIYHGSQSNVLQNIVSCARASDVSTVIIDGNIIVEDGALRTINEQKLIRKCQEMGSTKFKNMS